MRELRAVPLRGMEEIREGDSLVEEILWALRKRKMKLLRGDVLVVKHKIVSKAEGRVVELASVKPSERARKWARRWGGDARVVELVLRESKRVVREGHGVLITETKQGFVCANSGVDLSNVDGGKSAVLLPKDADGSAARLHAELKKKTGLHVPVIVTDSWGRPWREGLRENAIGVAGMKVMRDYRGRRDEYGYELRVTEEALADEIASAAGLVSGKLRRVPVVVVRGVEYEKGKGGARGMRRERKRDLFL